MHLLPTDEQNAIVATARAVLNRELDGWDRMDRSAEVATSLRRCCADLGWWTLGLPESAGGVGYGLVEEMLLYHEVGRHMPPLLGLGTVMGARAAYLAGAEGVQAAIANGSQPVGLALGGTLAIDAQNGGLVLKLEATGAQLFETVGVDVVGCIDATLSLADVSLGACVASCEDPTLIHRLRVLVAAMAVGLAESAKDSSAAFTSDRSQFGRAIGSFQAVKHRCADMVGRCEAALAQTSVAALAIDSNNADTALQSAAALLVATQAATRNAHANLQNHGGIGYTMEGSPHHLVRRAAVLERVGGPLATHLHAVVEAPAFRFDD